MTFETLSVEGNTPVSNERLIRVERGIEISCFKSLRILTGILLGPVDLDVDRELITLTISSGVEGTKNIECKLRLRRKSEKFLFVGGIVSLMVSAMDVKKSLK